MSFKGLNSYISCVNAVKFVSVYLLQIMYLISPPGFLEVLEHVIIARRPLEPTLEGLEDVEVAARQDMEETVASEEVRI